MNDPAIQAILEARARALARVPPAQEADDGADFIVIALGPERYGVPLKLVREIRPCERVTPIPGTPPFWFGLANLRGRLHPVLGAQGALIDEAASGAEAICSTSCCRIRTAFRYSVRFANLTRERPS